MRTFLESRAIHLCTLSLLAKYLTPENCRDLLEPASRKTKVAVEKLLVARGYSVPGVARVTMTKLGKDNIKVAAIELVAIMHETEKADVLKDSGHTNGSTNRNTSSHAGGNDKIEQGCETDSQELLLRRVGSNICGANDKEASANAQTIETLGWLLLLCRQQRSTLPKRVGY